MLAERRRMEMHKCTDELERLFVVASSIYFDLSANPICLDRRVEQIFRVELIEKNDSSAFTAMMPSIQVGCGRESWYVHRSAQ